MNKFKRVSAAVLAGMLLLATTGLSYALGIGQPSSRAILGERLSVTIPVRIEVNESLDNRCLAADVYFGDDKLPPEDIEVALLPGWTAERTITVHTNRVIHEPVVTVYLIAGCQPQITRKFVAFADPPGMAPTLPATGASRDSSLVAQVPLGASDRSAIKATRPTRSANATDAPEPKVRKTPAAGVKVRPSAPEKAASPSAANASKGSASAGSALAQAPSLSITPGKDSASSGASRQDAPPAATGAGRLVLDASDIEVVNLPGLRMTSNLLGVMAGDNASPEVLAHRAAAAALWRALNASPEDMARDQLRVAELEQRLASLQAEAKQSREANVALQARLAQAEGRRWLT